MPDLTPPEANPSELLTAMFGPRNGPVDALEQFLLIDLDQLVQHQGVLAFVVYRYKMALADCNKNILQFKNHVEKLEVRSLQYWREQKQPGTERVYSFEEGKEMRKLDPSVIANENLLGLWVNRREELLAYLKALEVKVSLSPGLQGLYTRIMSDQ